MSTWDRIVVRSQTKNKFNEVKRRILETNPKLKDHMITEDYTLAYLIEYYEEEII